MPSMTVQLHGIPDTEAAIGWAGAHSIVVDRPEGKAGGQGLGFNGGQLLALAIGGCFCNDLRYVAHDMGITLVSLSVEVSVDFEGSPLLATAARMEVTLKAADENADTATLIRRAREISTVSNSLARGLPVSLSVGGGVAMKT